MFTPLSKKNKNITTVAFYNVENLFDTVDDPHTFDDDFTSEGKKKWNTKRYRDKIKKLGTVISKLGNEQSLHPPALIGLVALSLY
jgi:hypothetical protein